LPYPEAATTQIPQVLEMEYVEPDGEVQKRLSDGEGVRATELLLNSLAWPEAVIQLKK
jgi:hypothetical protein